MDNNIKSQLTFILALVCSVSIVCTKGETGVGWFCLGLLFIWG